MAKSDLDTLSREELVGMVKMLSRDLVTIDGLWFAAVEQRFGLEKAIDCDTEVWHSFGSRDADRVKDVLKVTENGIASLVQVLSFSSCAQTLDCDIPEASQKRAVFNITNCWPQKARVRKGKGEFPCKPAGIAYFEEFAKVIDPSLKVKCLVCPPDGHPDNLWCSWEFELK